MKKTIFLILGIGIILGILLSIVTSVQAATPVTQVVNGGTGATTFTIGNCLKGNGTAPVTTGACGSGTVSSGLQGQNAFYNANGTTITATSTIFTAQNSTVGISSTTPAAEFGIHAVAGSAYPNNWLFNIGSSTASATTSLLSVDNAGVTTLAPGADGAATLTFRGMNTGYGFYESDTADISLTGTSAANPQISFHRAGGIQFNSGNGVSWANGSSANGTSDVGMRRIGVNTLIINSGSNSTAATGNLLDGGEGIGTTTPFALLSVNGTWNTNTPLFDVATTTLTGTTTAFFVASNANVGIGTTSPGSLLSVQGIANFTTGTSTFQSTGGINLANGGCYAVNGICISGGTNYFTLTGSNLQNNVGNALGINTIPTIAALEVQASSTTGNAFTAWSTTASNLFSILNNGNVGISTSSPLSKLSVGGNASIGADYNVAAPTNGLIVEGNTAIGTTTTLSTDPLTVYGGNITDNATNGNEGFVLKRNGALIGSFFSGTVAGATSPIFQGVNGRTISFNNANSSANIVDFADPSGNILTLMNNNGYFGVATTSNPLNSLVVGASESIGTDYNIAAPTNGLIVEGTVGIGTSTPGSIFSVQGVANFTTATSSFKSTGGINLTNGGCYAINGSCIGGGGGGGYSPVGTIGQFPYFSASNTLTATSSLYLATNSRVGIGTTTPGYLLDLVNTDTGIVQTVNSKSALNLTNLNATDGAFSQVSFSGGDSITPAISLRSKIVGSAFEDGNTSQPDGGLDFYVDNQGTLSDTLSLSPGTAIIKATLTLQSGAGGSGGLTVAGGVTFSNVVSCTGAGKALTTISFGTLTCGTPTLGTVGQISYLSGSNATVGTSTITIATNSRVGIGSTTPTSAFSVEGTVSLHGLTTGAGNGALCASSAGLVSFDTGANCITSSERFKNQITDLSASSSLSEILQLKPVSFYYKNGFGDNGKSEWVGFIAEQVATVDKRLVQYDANGDGKPYSVYYQNFTALLAGAVQQLNTKQDAQQVQIDKLQAEVSDLKNQKENTGMCSYMP